MKFFAPSEIQNVYQALALEDRLLDDPLAEEGVLFCWSGERAVVMGKNQNPWRECNLAFIQEHHCKLARRVSGGGAVYHDPGNLNISWVLPRERYRTEEMHSLLIRSLESLGIDAAVGNSGSLTVGGKKISGSAFCYRRDRVLHHGTLLMDADLNELRAALSPPRFQMQTHAVASLPAPVVNLKSLDPGLEKSGVITALKKVAEENFGEITLLTEQEISGLEIKNTAEKFSSPAWLWAQTPGFRSQLELPDGRDFHFRVHKGRITHASFDGEEQPVQHPPDFPDGEYWQLETQFGLPERSIAPALEAAGWKIF